MSTQEQANTKQDRIYSLDGLRGVACLVVLLLHIGIMLQPFGPSNLYDLMPGTAAVMVFYVLSGVVLSLAPLKRMKERGYDWFAYYPRRIVRLCVPLFAAILVGVAAGFAAQAIGSSSRSALAVDYAQEPHLILHDILMQFDILFNVSDGLYTLWGEPLTRVNSPVWSMSWEMWFSIALPLCIFLVLLIRRTGAALLILVACVFVAHFTGYFPLRFAIMFILGVVIAKHYERLAHLKMPAALEIAALIVCIALIELPQCTSGSPAWNACTQTLMNIASAGLVILALSNGICRKALSVRPCQWLGKVSYSMYLTNAVIIGGLQAVFPGIDMPGIMQLIVALAASFIIAWVFWYLIERPSISWSHRIGKLAAQMGHEL